MKHDPKIVPNRGQLPTGGLRRGTAVPGLPLDEQSVAVENRSCDVGASWAFGFTHRRE
jgi:hypothetical protein